MRRFTLIELLVSIAIIAMVGGILAAAFWPETPLHSATVQDKKRVPAHMSGNIMMPETWYVEILGEDDNGQLHYKTVEVSREVYEAAELNEYWGDGEQKEPQP